jgi:hypothetical protein
MLVGGFFQALPQVLALNPEEVAISRAHKSQRPVDERSGQNPVRFSVRAAPIAEGGGSVCPQHRRSQPEATKLTAAATTQSVAITCAQIATIPKNSASEASVATSSKTARPMSLTPLDKRPKIQRVRVLECAFPGRPWERLSFRWSRWQWKGSIARRTLGLSLTYLVVSTSRCRSRRDWGHSLEVRKASRCKPDQVRR